jgi:hypothetical protein
MKTQYISEEFGEFAMATTESQIFEKKKVI